MSQLGIIIIVESVDDDCMARSRTAVSCKASKDDFVTLFSLVVLSGDASALGGPGLSGLPP